MNTYSKYCPNVYLAKCPEKHNKGDIIEVTTRYNSENECIVHNLIYEKSGFYFYSITRVDGFNCQERSKKKAERLFNASANAQKKSNEYYKKSNEGKDFLSLGEPIKIGHHSEKRHRALIERNHNRMGKSIEYGNKSERYQDRASYWENKENEINLSMPESIDYYKFLLEKRTKEHQEIKDNKEKREHSFSLTYAKKYVNEAKKNLETAIKLWGSDNSDSEKKTEILETSEVIEKPENNSGGFLQMSLTPLVKEMGIKLKVDQLSLF